MGGGTRWDGMRWDAMGCDAKRWELHHRRFQRLLATHSRAPAAPRASAAHPRCRATAAPLGLSFILSAVAGLGREAGRGRAAAMGLGYDAMGCDGMRCEAMGCDA